MAKNWASTTWDLWDKPITLVKDNELSDHPIAKLILVSLSICAFNFHNSKYAPKPTHFKRWFERNVKNNSDLNKVRILLTYT